MMPSMITISERFRETAHALAHTSAHLMLLFLRSRPDDRIFSRFCERMRTHPRTHQHFSSYSPLQSRPVVENAGVDAEAAGVRSPGSAYIGNYRVIKTLGQGNFARVKLAEHVLTGEEV